MHDGQAGQLSVDLHRPVMLAEVLEALGASGGGTFVDATLGLGGHSEGILISSPQSRVIGLDRDCGAIEKAKARLEQFGSRFCAIHSDYRRIREVLNELQILSVDGILADLGVSSWQLDSPRRGFSFRFGSEPLDMRMDQGEPETAAHLVNRLSERELADIIWRFGEEPGSRRIAKRIVEQRTRQPINTTGELAELVVRVLHPKGKWRVHPATRTFQALRIAVNQELEGLDSFINDCIELLTEGGRLAVITFHSLEDRIIKQALKVQSGGCICPPRQPACTCGARHRIELITKKPIVAGQDEVSANPRARSAKLRACRKLPLAVA
jgi:16S rRNA (cytosine1402-N4)-methyltransferase